MKKINTLGSVISFDPNNNVALFKFKYVDIELLEQIELLLEHEGSIKLSFKGLKPFRSKTYKQQKKFWVDFDKIIKAFKIPKTKDNCTELYEHIKLNIFPAKKSSIAYNEEGKLVDSFYPSDMKDLSIEEMAEVIEKLHQYYAYLNIDWDRKE